MGWPTPVLPTLRRRLMMAITDEGIDLVAAAPLERLDRYLADHCPGLTRAAAQRLIREGWVSVNGAPAKASLVPSAGDRIHIARLASQGVPLRAVPSLPLSVLYEDGDLLVLDKPAGLVVHPGAGHNGDTLVDILLAYRPSLADADLDSTRPGIVHRLDRDTSGLIIVAANRAAQQALQAQFKGRTVEKVYQALAYGHLAPAEARIEAPLARDPQQRQRMAVAREGGRMAITHYRVAEYLRGACLAEVALLTGRTHQIRVHLSSIGHPIVGDRIYGPRRQAIPAPRQMLHAWRLSFDPPTRHERLTFTAEIPSDMARLIARLRAQD
jgi:23S rRNA pseudouridine1911/1915/1917 synthase